MKEDRNSGSYQCFPTSPPSLEQARQPLEVIHSILDSYSAKDLQAGLWDLLYYATTSPAADGLPAHIRARYLEIYKMLIRMTDACALIDQCQISRSGMSSQSSDV